MYQQGTETVSLSPTVSNAPKLKVAKTNQYFQKIYFHGHSRYVMFEEVEKDQDNLPANSYMPTTYEYQAAFN